MDIVFARPEVLYLLIIVLPVAAVFANTYRWKERSRNALMEYAMAPVLLASVSIRGQRIKSVLILAAVAALVVAMAQPQLAGAHETEVALRDGADIMVVLDVSLSMATQDVAPSRLERAKQELGSLLSQLEGDRVGMIVLAGSSTLRFPLTTDTEAARLLVATTAINSAPAAGTELDKGIRLASGILRQSETKDRFILVISDGENQRGEPVQAAEDAKSDGIVVHALGVGTREGARIPVRDQAGRSSFKTDAAGTTVISRLDESLLSKITSASGGNYIRLESSPNAAQQIYKGMAKSVGLQGNLTGKSGQLYQIVALVALLLLFYEPMVSERRKNAENE
ncbi:MAG: VWA domain-containing protein [Dehalococcoidia bacterium]|nr:VWA domain-containing protein [Dehalococcoidia bacterium]